MGYTLKYAVSHNSSITRFAFKVGLALSLMGIWVASSCPGQAAELAEIQERGYLVVGVKDNLRPLGFRDEAGELKGLEIELAYWLAGQLLGDPEAVVLQPITNVERLPALLNDEVDLVIARLTATVSRSRLVDFSLPYYLDGTALITRRGSIQTLTDLQSQTIAVLEGSDTIAVVRSYLPTARLVGAESYEQARQLLETNQAFAFAADVSVLTGWVQEDPNYHLLPVLLSTEALAVAMPRGLQYTELRQQVNQAVQQWQTEGTLAERVLYWGLPEEGVPSQNLDLNEPEPSLF
ncbi:MAG: transporter substrate-binding domain-containing protein [Elainellaceae cyanobacterium]